MKERLKGKGLSFGCYYGFGDQGIGLEMPLADYLSHWPDAQAQVKSYTSTLDGKLHVWSEWPWQTVGTLPDGSPVWVKAETKSEVLEVKAVEQPAAVSAEAVAA